MSTITYQVCPKNPNSHLFEIQCHIPKPNPQGQQFMMPAWIPGSYLIRDFAKHIVSLVAESKGKKLKLKRFDKHRWQCEPSDGPLIINYQVYANDLTPRGVYLDNTHAFFNGSRLLLQIVGFENEACELVIRRPMDLNPLYHHWQVGTAMTPVQVDDSGFGFYQARNYEDLIDYPFEIGEFERLQFEALGIPHKILITGKKPFGDTDRLVDDIKKICEYQLQFFRESTSLNPENPENPDNFENSGPDPFDRYVFLLTVTKGGYGGLEHGNSTALQVSYENFPKFYEDYISEGYRTLLGLFSHEYFHLWNVKRIKPKAFTPQDLTQENYTSLLWIFEGITSYYDDLTLLRSGIITIDSYLEIIGKLMTLYYRTPGRLKQTLEESSFEAWIKFYRPDEYSLNATISYYLKGALVSLLLDLFLRNKTEGRVSLDDVMRVLWNRYGQVNKGLPEEAFELLVAEVSGLEAGERAELNDFFEKALRTTEELPFEILLETVGLEIDWQLATNVDDPGKSSGTPLEILANRPLLEVKLKPSALNLSCEIASVIADSAAEASGLLANDIIIAVNGFKVDRNNLDSTIARFTIGDRVTIHAFRQDELRIFEVALRGAWLKNAIIKRKESPTDIQNTLFNGWLSVSSLG